MMVWTLAQAAADPAANDAFFLWGCLLFGAAVVLLFIELFVPSGGLLGVLCGVAAVASVVCFWRYDAAWGIAVGLGYIVLTPITLVFVFKLWVNSPIGRAMILGIDTAGHSDEPEAAGRDRHQRLEELRALIGAEGVAETALRPVGTVRIGDQRVDGMAESGVIEPNTPIVVCDVYDNQIKVRPL